MLDETYRLALVADGLVVVDDIDDARLHEDKVDMVRFLFPSREECIAAIRTLCWLTANSYTLTGYCTPPEYDAEARGWGTWLGAA